MALIDFIFGSKKTIRTERQKREINNDMARAGLNQKQREEVWQRMHGHMNETRPEERGIDADELGQTMKMMREETKRRSHDLRPEQLDAVEEAFKKQL